MERQLHPPHTRTQCYKSHTGASRSTASQQTSRSRLQPVFSTRLSKRLAHWRKRRAPDQSVVDSVPASVAQSVTWHRKNKDDRDNAESVPPENEKVLLNCIWVVEAYPPSQIENLKTGLQALGWDKGSPIDSSPGEWLAESRRQFWGGAGKDSGLLLLKVRQLLSALTSGVCSRTESSTQPRSCINFCQASRSRCSVLSFPKVAMIAALRKLCVGGMKRCHTVGQMDGGRTRRRITGR